VTDNKQGACEDGSGVGNEWTRAAACNACHPLIAALSARDKIPRRQDFPQTARFATFRPNSDTFRDSKGFICHVHSLTLASLFTIASIIGLRNSYTHVTPLQRRALPGHNDFIPSATSTLRLSDHGLRNSLLTVHPRGNGEHQAVPRTIGAEDSL
jgi:hypothetical protein